MRLKMLDEKFDSHPTRFCSIQQIFFFFFQFLLSTKNIQHFIQHPNFLMSDEMLDRFNSALLISYRMFLVQYEYIFYLVI